jgi:cytochrome P450
LTVNERATPAVGITDATARLRAAAEAGDPFAVYDELRPHSPVRTGSRSWLLVTYDHARAALADPDRFSSNVRDSDNPVFRNSPLVFDDPPRHTRLRRLVAAAFTPARVAAAEPWIRALADELLERMGSGPVDFVESYADPLPVLVIARLLGVPTGDAPRFKQWSDDRAYVVYHSRGPRTEAVDAAEAGCRALDEYLTALARERRAAPGPDLVSALATAEVDGERLGIEDVAGTCAVLLSAGNLTTTRLLANLVATLAGAPDRFASLREDRSIASGLVEESLRLDSPVQTPIRRTLVDVEIGNTVIPAGHFVTVGIGAANRDPDRTGEPHLAFGHGIHYCLGATLARMEAKVTLDALAERYSTIRFAEPPVRDPSLAHRGYRILRLVLDR